MKRPILPVSKEAVQKYIEEHTKTPEAAKKKLMGLGIINKDGNLTENYK